MDSVEELRDVMEELLEAAGFTPDLYLIRRHDKAIAVHFDQKEAAMYFMKEVETSRVSELVCYSYREDGKRHVAYIQLW